MAQPAAAKSTRTGYLLAYALTKGIIECEFVVDDGATLLRRANDPFFNHYSSVDVCWTRDEAIERLREIIEAKRASIEKQIRKLDKLAASPRFITEAKVWGK